MESNQSITIFYKLKSNFKRSLDANFSSVLLSPCSINFFIVLVEKSAFLNIVGDSDSLLVILVTDFITEIIIKIKTKILLINDRLLHLYMLKLLICN